VYLRRAASYDGGVGLAAVLVPASYFLGTFPTAALVARRAGHDPSREGSGNPGASNVYRIAGTRAGLAVFAGDLAKGVVATGAGLAAGGRGLAMACGAAAVVGHCFPAPRRFRGGRGVATAAGMACVLFPALSALLLVGWVVVAKAARKASLASLSVAVALPVLVAATGRAGREVAAVAAVSLLVVGRHAGNLRRLVRGEERELRAGGV
jgi:glycerol-3-phosphate acyltransferase PlsY